MLDAFRKEIDRIDSALIPLILERLELAKQIAAEKRKTGVAIIDTEREDEILRSVAAASEDPVLREKMLCLYRELLHCSQDVQQSVIQYGQALSETGAERE